MVLQIASIAIILGSYAPAQQRASADDGWTLLRNCQKSVESAKGRTLSTVEHIMSETCIAYTAGVTDGLVFESKACVPDGIVYEALATIVYRFLEANPSRLHTHRFNLAREALMNALPCPPPRR